MSKFYQHINSDDPKFQTTTKLLYVDDSDPDLLLYNFEDGTKCSAEFIAKIDDFNANSGTYHMVEVESPVNIWRFKPIEVKAGNLMAKTADGQDVEVPDPYFVGLSGNNAPLNGSGAIKEGTRWESRPPRPAVRPIDDINEYFGSYIKYAVENNVKINKDINTKLVMDAMDGKLAAIEKEEKTPVTEIQAEAEKPQPLKTSLAPVSKAKPTEQQNPFAETKKHLIINADDLINSNDYDIVKLTYNGEVHEIDINTFFAQSIEEQKIVEVSQPANNMNITMDVAVADSDIPIDIINTPEWGLINNMINMSQKEECAIDMELVLSLPPVEVYKLIKTAYPKGLSDVFVKTIANRMPIKELRIALAHGLMCYYDGDAEEIEEYEAHTEEKAVYTPSYEELNRDNIALPKDDGKKIVKKPRTKKSGN